MTAALDADSRIVARLQEVFQRGEGQRLFRFLRDVYYAGDGGRAYDIESQIGPESILRVAKDLHLVTTTRRGGIKLSPLGYRVGNVAKEYSNWIDEGRPLPRGVTTEDVCGKRVLDVGCGFGRYLLAYTGAGASYVCGIEPDDLYRSLGAVIATHEGVDLDRIVSGTAESLPCADEQYEVLICRLVLTYVRNVRCAIAEFRRVLVPGGRIIVHYPTFHSLGKLALHSIRTCNVHAMGWYGFAMVNTILMEVTGRQLCLRRRGRMHSLHSPNYPSGRWIHHVLSDSGFLVEKQAGNLQGGTVFRAKCK